MLEAIGYDPRMARWAAAVDSRVGRVLHVERGVASLLTEDGMVRASYGGRMLGWIASDRSATPCAGDWVVVRDWPDRRVTLEKVVPRRTSLVRGIGSTNGCEHVMAANIDLVAVVVAADALPEPTRLRPVMAMARASGATPLLVLTKCDLVADPEACAERFCRESACHVMCTSATTGMGVDELRGLVDRHLTMAMIGRPDQGQSRLVRALVGADVVRPTGRRRLHLLPAGGAVIETPSLRAVA